MELSSSESAGGISLGAETAIQEFQRSDTDRFALLTEASRALLAPLSLEATLIAIMRLSRQLMTADAYAIWSYDLPAQSVRVISSEGLSPAYLDASELPLPGGEPPKSGLEVAATEVEADPRLRDLATRYKAEGITSLLALPLHGTDGEYGSLTFYYRSVHEFPDDELMIGRAIANLASVAIAAANLRQSKDATEKALRETIREQKRAENGLELLSNAGLILGESLDYKTTLTNLIRSVVPALADWCAVHVLEGDLARQVAVAHKNPGKLRWAEELQQKYPQPDNPDAPWGVRHVIRTGISEFVPEIPPELLQAAAVDEERAKIIDELGLKSYICVPLKTRTDVIGALTLIYAESGRVYEGRDLQLAEEVGRRAGLAVEKARLFAESEAARAELERSNEAKDEFLGIVSHELRAPITTIFGSARLISARRSSLTDEQQAELVDGIETEARKMIGLIENLLLLARSEIGQEPVKSRVAIESVLERIVSAHGPSSRVRVDRAPEVDTVLAEPTYLEQVLLNLVQNADKYSPLDDVIELVIEKHADEVMFRVRDRGPGVAPEELNLIFDSFYRGQRTAQMPGKGLGLAICKRLIEAQGGRIWARLPSGGGLEVGFALPDSRNAATDD